MLPPMDKVIPSDATEEEELAIINENWKRLLEWEKRENFNRGIVYVLVSICVVALVVMLVMAG